MRLSRYTLTDSVSPKPQWRPDPVQATFDYRVTLKLRTCGSLVPVRTQCHQGFGENLGINSCRTNFYFSLLEKNLDYARFYQPTSRTEYAHLSVDIENIMNYIAYKKTLKNLFKQNKVASDICHRPILRTPLKNFARFTYKNHRYRTPVLKLSKFCLHKLTCV